MKYHSLSLIAVAVGVILAVGCESPSGRPDNTATGALVGGATGAGIGAIVGGRNAGAGALIGGAVGALTGGIIGHSIDEQQRQRIQAYSPQTLVRVDQGQPLEQADIKALAKAGVSDEVIISQIRNSHTVYHLSTAEILDLKDAGVSEQVIDIMINTASETSAPPPPPPPPSTDYQEVVVSQPPPPPICGRRLLPGTRSGYVWVGGYWGWYGGRWAWYRGRWAWPPHRHAAWVGGYYERRGGSGVWISGHWR